MDQQIINYQRIQQAIEYLSAHVTDQPSLEEVAEQVHLSPFHFQRMFKEWAGISPKKFLQYLTKEYLKSHIIQSPNFLELSEQAGLSSSSRVHDLFSKLEGVTPQEYKSMGEQLTIRYGFHSSPFGACLIGSTKRGICHLVFIEEKNKEEELGKLEDNWPLAKLVEDPGTTVNWCSHIFSTPNDQKQEKPRLSLFVKGTYFQLKVWEALLQVPFGALCTYAHISAAVGNPHAFRAVGTAIGHNLVGYLIPCHRVIRKEGTLGGYRWGVERKRVILGWEAATVSQQ